MIAHRTRRDIRVWLDELLALPEYSCSVPDGKYPGKQWRCAADYRADRATCDWLIRTYVDPGDRSGELLIFSHRVVLLQGPRRGHEPSRLNSNGRRGKVPSTFPHHM